MAVHSERCVLAGPRLSLACLRGHGGPISSFSEPGSSDGSVYVLFCLLPRAALRGGEGFYVCFIDQGMGLREIKELAREPGLEGRVSDPRLMLGPRPTRRECKAGRSAGLGAAGSQPREPDPDPPSPMRPEIWPLRRTGESPVLTANYRDYSEAHMREQIENCFLNQAGEVGF